MSIVDSEAIVLRTYNLAEADKIVVCLTKCCGIVRAVARGARRLKSKFGASLEPLTVLNISYYEKEGRELVTLRQAEIVRSYFNLTRNAENLMQLAYISELALEFAPPREPNEKLFRMLCASLECLAENPATGEGILRYCEIWILKLGGFWPDLHACADCGKRFNSTENFYLNSEKRLRCRSCSQGMGNKLSAEAHARLESARRLPPCDFARAYASSTQSSGEELRRFNESLIERVLDKQVRGLKVPYNSNKTDALI
jgi:DNA repair protein RecO (recombination protein O)